MIEPNLYSELDRETFFLKPRQILRTLISKRLILMTLFIGFLTAGNFYCLFFHAEYWTARTHLKVIGPQHSSKQINILASDVFAPEILNQVLANLIAKNLPLSTLVPKPHIFEILHWLKKEKNNGLPSLMKQENWQTLVTYLRSTITPTVDNDGQELVINVKTRSPKVSMAIADFIGQATRQYHYLNQKSKIQEIEF